MYGNFMHTQGTGTEDFVEIRQNLNLFNRNCKKRTVERILKPVQELNCLIRKELNNNNKKNKKNLRYFPYCVEYMLFLLVPSYLRGGRLYSLVLRRHNSPQWTRAPHIIEDPPSYSDIPHSVRLLWTCDQPDTQTSI